jgi:hypothetical protein
MLPGCAIFVAPNLNGSFSFGSIGVRISSIWFNWALFRCDAMTSTKLHIPLSSSSSEPNRLLT